MLLRPAQPSDALAIARVHVRAWQHGYAGILPASYLNQLRPEDRAEKYDLSHADPSHPHTIVATDADIISPTETSSLGNIASHSPDPAGKPAAAASSTKKFSASPPHAPRKSPTFPITASSQPSMSIPIPGAAASASRSSPPPAPISSLSRCATPTSSRSSTTSAPSTSTNPTSGPPTASPAPTPSGEPPSTSSASSATSSRSEEC